MSDLSDKNYYVSNAIEESAPKFISIRWTRRSTGCWLQEHRVYTIRVKYAIAYGNFLFVLRKLAFLPTTTYLFSLKYDKILPSFRSCNHRNCTFFPNDFTFNILGTVSQNYLCLLFFFFFYGIMTKMFTAHLDLYEITRARNSMHLHLLS